MLMLLLNSQSIANMKLTKCFALKLLGTLRNAPYYSYKSFCDSSVNSPTTRHAKFPMYDFICNRTSMELNEATDDELLQLASKLGQFITKHSVFNSVNVVSYIKDEQWRLIPEDWLEALKQITPDEVAMLPSGFCKDEWPESLKEFVNTSQELSLKRLPPNPQKSSTITVKDSLHRFRTSQKKRHEIEILGRFIGDLAPKVEAASVTESGEKKKTLVIEAGSGHGYLSTMLSTKFSMNVIGIDGSSTYAKSAAERSEVISKRKQKKEEKQAKQTPEAEKPTSGSSESTPTSSATPQFLSGFIPSNTTPEQFQQMLNFSPSEPIPNCILVGLHTCGDLAPTTLRLFGNCSDVSIVISVGCCYHKLTEVGDAPPDASVVGFPMSKAIAGLNITLGSTAKMTACQAIHRWEKASNEEEKQTNALMFKKHSYRAVFEMVLFQRLGIRGRDCGGVGKVRNSGMGSFPIYVRSALKSLKLDELEKVKNDEVINSDEKLEELYEQYQDKIATIPIFWSLRACLGAPVESLILLDRLLYLREKNVVAALLPLFDPVISPRNIVVCGLRHCTMQDVITAFNKSLELE